MFLEKRLERSAGLAIRRQELSPECRKRQYWMTQVRLDLPRQPAVKHWHEALSNPALAGATFDRLLHRAYIIELEGPSLREACAKAQQSSEPAALPHIGKHPLGFVDSVHQFIKLPRQGLEQRIAFILEALCFPDLRIARLGQSNIQREDALE